MEKVAQNLSALVKQIVPQLLAVPEAEASKKPAPNKWSKKEILGHLIDSAANNQQKFIRTLLATETVNFVGYEQDDWVSSQQYNQQQWRELVDFWVSYNRHLVHIIKNVAPEKLHNNIVVSGNGPFTLAFIMEDYVEHLMHHLIQIFPNAGLRSNFSMSPYV